MGTLSNRLYEAVEAVHTSTNNLCFTVEMGRKEYKLHGYVILMKFKPNF